EFLRSTDTPLAGLRFRQTGSIHRNGQNLRSVQGDHCDYIFQGWYLPRVGFTALVFLSCGVMLQDDTIGGGGYDPFRSGRSAWIGQGRLSFKEHDVGISLPITPDNSMFEFTRHKIIQSRVEDEAILRTLHPPGLPGVYHLSGITTSLH